MCGGAARCGISDEHMSMNLSRRSFIGNLTVLGGDWVMPLPAAKSKVFSFETRRAKEKPPAFPAGAKLAVARVEATNRGGKAKVN